MHARSYLPFILTIWACCASSLCMGQIYKTTDAQGNTLYTDQPAEKNPDSNILTINQTNVYQGSTPSSDEPPASAYVPRNASPTRYQNITIIAPADDEAIRDNAGYVTIHISTQPILDVGNSHTIDVLLDGKQAGTIDGNTLRLSNIDRGTHQLDARIVNGSGEVLLQSSPTRFHMLRAHRNSSTN